MATERKRVSIRSCCRHLGFSKQAYYQFRHHREDQAERDRQIVGKVLTVRRHLPRLGTRKLYYLLKGEFVEAHISVGRDKLFDVLRAQKMLITKRRKYIQTTDSKHWMRTYPNRAQHMPLTQPEQLWVADITYILTRQETLYLHLVTDAYSKQIMGYMLSRDLKSESTLKALQMALGKRMYPQHQIIHHSDRGLQFCSKLYINELRKHNCQISMTQDGNPYDNAVAERINGILKDKFYCDEPFENYETALASVAQSIILYNTRRPHLSCSMLTPVQMHQQQELLVKQWNKKPLYNCREVI
jgi:transposase InsO family protein